jgi:hypothetical protein
MGAGLVALYRMMGTSMGRLVFVGLDTRLAGQFQESVRIESVATPSFPGVPSWLVQEAD